MPLETQQQTLSETIARTAWLHDLFEQYGDEERARKAKLFLRKLHDEEFIVAFCGHFSAGKSTMINELTGEKLLPSSPIPTSANLVKIHKAPEDFAKVYYKDRQPLLFQAPYRFEKVKEYCKNGEEVEAIEIGHSESSLPPEVTVMDTPGVDSTDDAHRISTESALHLADMVFYVMDYNHVQSELNFIYTKDLLSHGVKLNLIINQIDKHRDEELSFDAFKQSVYDSFASWNVHPEKFYFTSLREPDLPYNDFAEVKELIHQSMANREQLTLRSAETMMSLLVSEHLQWLQDGQEEVREQLQEVLGEGWMAEEIIANEQKTKAELDKRDANALVKSVEEGREKVLQNAYLMPASTRQLAKDFLEAMQPEFKVGLFFSKKKTEEERQRRLDVLMVDLKEKTEAQLEWHLRQLFASWLKSSGLISDSLQLEAEELSIPFDASLLKDTIKAGAQVTGDYVLNYCDDVANQLKKKARMATDELKTRASQEMAVQFASEQAGLKEKWQAWHQKLTAIQQLTDLDTTMEEHRSGLHELMIRSFSDVPESFDQFVQEWKKEQKQVDIFSGEWEEEAATTVEKVEQKEETVVSSGATVAVNDTVSKLKNMNRQLDGIPGFQRFIDGLRQKADRLEQRKYTIALFGAFSAGKSSFANAMLGEKVLPVSPNPTTAAVNRIHPPDEQHPHRTAAVHLKTEQDLLLDIQHSLQLFDRSVTSLVEANQVIPELLIANEGEGREKIHLSFLKAFHDGFNEYKEQLGTTLLVDLQAFQGFVANEKQSCFVESIDLYYDCDFTRQGVTLVDTPGADSINARHTGVAFEYIKNSDAILFVTYYNHAFSKADREFLIQLGRVKDAFELDKMFFIVNAIDLAKDEEEVQEVKNYVTEQLLQYGIRFPRLFGVSSLQAIQEIERGETDHPNSNIVPFKQAFHQFLDGDLAHMAVQSAEAEWERGVERLRQLIATAKENRDNREQKQQQLNDQQQQVATHLTNETSQLLEKRLSQEINELVYYLKQRVFYRFSDFFKESFNPATLTSNQIKAALNDALKELLEAVGYDLAQEMRATSLRTENHVHELLTEKYANLQLHYQTIQPQLSFTPLEWSSQETPEFPTAFTNEPLSTFNQALSLFKNAKSFFEKNEKQQMQEQLEEKLSTLADVYLETEKEKLWTWAYHELDAGITLMKTTVESDAKEQFTAWLDVLDHAENIDEWERVLVELQRA
ncbi:dynamin family protein [Bacillus sp. FJAT-42315]|uniref:dynamin family protein n=1 Tax=Bacillus sp. FJAT-42315 TaxID=2014077 RepID=UPI000C2481C6|nr:dynamin family protein [Bacillus sp. FJAT-42315]